MKAIVFGSTVPAEYENAIEHISNAANRFINNLCKVLSKQIEVRRISYLGIDVPIDILEKLSLDGECDYVYKSKFRLKSIIELKKLVRKRLKEVDILISYNVFYGNFWMPVIAKRMGKKSVLILADYSDSSSYTNILRKVYAKYQLKSIRKYDCVIGLSEMTKRYLSTKQKFVCMEGGIDQAVYDKFSEKYVSRNDDNIVYMYSGILERVTGVDNLIEAFYKIDNNAARLWISGKGSLQSLVEDATKNDSRIFYLGMMEYDDYIETLKRADVLVNPRNMDLPENRNNFPSKVMEYLATGKSIISTKFPGWDRFKDNIVFCDNIEEGLLINIDKGKNIYLGNRRKAEEFLWSNQVKLILEMIRKI